MGRSRSPSFVCELPLRVDQGQETVLLRRLDAGRQLYNACLGEGLRRWGLVKQSKGYQRAKRLPKDSEQARKLRAKAFQEANLAHGLSEYGLHAYVTELLQSWLGQHLDANTGQTLATRAYKAIREWVVGKRGKPRFKGQGQLLSLEGKTNKQGLRFMGGQLVWKQFQADARIKPTDQVQASGLASRIKFVRLVTRKLKGKHRFYAQLVCEGIPHHKLNQDGSFKHPYGKGVVRQDIGPSTIAIVADQHVEFRTFGAELERRDAAIRRLQRHIDRQRRANNPDHYLPDSRIKPGTRTWVISKRQRAAQDQLVELHRRQAEHRKSLHGKLANQILSLGDQIKTEKLSYKAFQRMFGRSVAFRAPGLFMSMLRRKAASAAASLDEFKTRTTRLSRTCHGCGQIVPKSLSQRFHICDCGLVTVHRDLYSAYLARYVLNDQCDWQAAQHDWPRFEHLLTGAEPLPAGVKPQASATG